jgi:DNA invertase Pin-like site-specific DNA recombinase
MKSPSIKPVRCAIYTRVSTDHGLDQEFNSLDAQYDAASAYIKSQAHAGWTVNRSRYDDGGYSGGSTDRPDLQKLLDDIRSRKIDVIVVYKVDRLTRSLADFAKLVELFECPRRLVRLGNPAVQYHDLDGPADPQRARTGTGSQRTQHPNQNKAARDGCDARRHPVRPWRAVLSVG